MPFRPGSAGAIAVAKAWEEDRHPHAPKGSPGGTGGEFVHLPGAGGDNGNPSEPRPGGGSLTDTVNATIKKLSLRYDVPVPKVVTTDLKGMRNAGGWTSGTSIHINPALLRDRERPWVTLVDGSHGILNPEGNSAYQRMPDADRGIEFIVTHEFGHWLFQHLPEEKKKELLAPFRKALMRDKNRDFKNPVAAQKIIADTSLYGSMTSSGEKLGEEGISEAFARGVLAEQGIGEANDTTRLVLDAFKSLEGEGRVSYAPGVFESAYGARYDRSPDAATADRRAGTEEDGRDAGDPGQATQVRVGFPGATEALRAFWSSDKHPRIPSGHGGGEFVHLPGTGPSDGTNSESQAAHIEKLERLVSSAMANGQATKDQFGFNPVTGVWDADRAKVHREILDGLWANAAHVPSDGKAIISGGLGGAGKSTVLHGPANIDQSQYLTVNADDVKEEMARRGLVPPIPGLKPMERSVLIHTEAEWIAILLAKRAIAARKNVIIDTTMNSRALVEPMLANLHAQGYKIRGIFVDIPVETSVERSMARYARDQNTELGGRYIPPRVIRRSTSTTASSVNREIFDDLRAHGEFDESAVYDNSGTAPVLVEGSAPAERSDSLPASPDGATDPWSDDYQLTTDAAFADVTVAWLNGQLTDEEYAKRVAAAQTARTAVGFPGASRAWDPGKHHRRPKGIEGGGQFAPSWSGVVPRKQAPPKTAAPARPEVDQAVITVDDFLHGKGPEPTDEQVDLLVEAHGLAPDMAAALRALVASRRKQVGKVQKKLHGQRIKKSNYQSSLEAMEKAGTIGPALQADLDRLRRSSTIPIGLKATDAERALASRFKNGAWDPGKHPRLPKGVHGGGEFGSGLGAPAVGPVGTKAAANVDTFLATLHTDRETLKANTRTLLDEASPETTAAGMGWYAEARRLSASLGAEYGIPSRAAITAVAALSPRCEWDGEPERSDGNLGHARKVFAAAQTPDDQPMTVTDAMFDKARKGLGGERDALLPESRRSAVVGTHPAGELNDAELAVFHPDITGAILPAAKARAMRAVRGHQAPNDALGGLKIRSFFDNLDRPDASPEVTIDSHQVRAMLADIATPDSVYTAIAGNPARYQAFADVVRDVAKERGLQPHQVQAIMWTEWKNRYDLGDRRLANRSTGWDVTGGPADHETIPVAEFDKLVAYGEEVVALSAAVNPGGTSGPHSGQQRGQGQDHEGGGEVEASARSGRPDARTAVGFPGASRALIGRFDESKVHRLPKGQHGGGEFGHLPGAPKVAGPDPAVAAVYAHVTGDDETDRVIAATMSGLVARYQVSPPAMYEDNDMPDDAMAGTAITPPHDIKVSPKLVTRTTEAREANLATYRLRKVSFVVGADPNLPQSDDLYIRETLSHEFGHLLADTMITKDRAAHEELLTPFTHALAEDEPTGGLANPNELLRLRNDVSQYAITDPTGNEAVAEAFVQGLLAEEGIGKPTPWSDHVMGVFDRVYGDSPTVRVGYPGATEALRKAGHSFDETRIHRLPSGKHGGGEFAHLPGTPDPALDRLHRLGVTDAQVAQLGGVEKLAKFSDDDIRQIFAPVKHYTPPPPRQEPPHHFDETITATTAELGDRYGLHPDISLGGNELGSNASTDAERPYAIHVDPRMTGAGGYKIDTRLDMEYNEPERLGYPHHTPQAEATADEFLRYTIEHEFAHTLTLTAVQYADGKEQAKGGPVNDLLQQMRDTLARPESMVELKNQISLYATKDEYEAIAEAFAVGRLAQRSGQPVPPLAQKVLDTFDTTSRSEALRDPHSRQPDLGRAGEAVRAGRLPVGYPGATEALRKAGHHHHSFDESKIHRKLKGQHGGGEFTHLPGSGDLEHVGGEKFSSTQPPEKKQKAGAWLHGMLQNWHDWPDLPGGGGHIPPAKAGEDFIEHHFELLAKDQGVDHGSRQVGLTDMQPGDKFVIPFGPEKGEIGIFKGLTPHQDKNGLWVDYYPPGQKDWVSFKLDNAGKLQVTGHVDREVPTPGRYPKQEGQGTVADKPIADAMTRLQAEYPRAPAPRIVMTDESRRYYATAHAFATTVNFPHSPADYAELDRTGLEADSINLNPELFANHVALKEHLDGTAANAILAMHHGDVHGLDAGGGTDEQVQMLITHEYAHYLANHLTQRQQAMLYAPFEQALAQHNIGEAGMGWDYDEPDLAAALYVRISPYATYSFGEAVAEAFTRGQLIKQGKITPDVPPNPWVAHVEKAFQVAYGAGWPATTDRPVQEAHG